MKVLLVLAVLFWMGADARHKPEHHVSQRIPPESILPWIPGKEHTYNTLMNITIGVPGMTSQVAKSVLKMTVVIRSIQGTDYVLQVMKAYYSKSESSVPSPEHDLPLIEISGPLENDLVLPCRFSYVDGQVKNIEFDSLDDYKSKAIKKALLHLLDMKIEELERGEANDFDFYPSWYNFTEENELGPFTSYYMIINSPYPWFPYDNRVLNISKTVDYHGYPSFFEHNNFGSQGCPDVCQHGVKYRYKRYGGHPGECIPRETPLTATMVVHHDYMYWNTRDSSATDEKNFVLGIIRGEESSVAKTYGQDIALKIESVQELISITDPIHGRDAGGSGRKTKDTCTLTPEHRWTEGVFRNCAHDDLRKMATDLLKDITAALLEGDITSTEGRNVTYFVVQLQDIMSLLNKESFGSIWNEVKRHPEHMTRQIFLNILPLCGTGASVAFIKDLSNMSGEEGLLVWETKDLLEAIPQNIINGSDQKILKDLEELIDSNIIHKHPILLSPAVMASSQVIRKACVVPKIESHGHYYEDERDSRRPQKKNQCGPSIVSDFTQKLKGKMVNSIDMREKIIYIQALAQLGDASSLEILKPYVYGLAADTRVFIPADVDFIKAVSIYALHNVVELYPNETLAIVAPVYFNRSEVPRVRMAAFSILIRCQPPLAILQHVAVDSWDEPSQEVGSLVYSTLLTFGNASIPCMKRTADKIKHVISQTKNYDIGWHHSKSIIKTFYDDLRLYGIEGRFVTVKSNASIVPSALYTALKYNMQSLRDTAFHFAANIQGVDLSQVIKYFDKLDLLPTPLKSAEDIPKEKENDIFDGLDIKPLESGPMRVAINRKFFYVSSFEYIDSRTLKEYLDAMRQYLRRYLGDSRGDVSNGYFTKIFIPSSFRTVSYTRAGFPVEFSMKHPIIVSIHVRTKKLQKIQMHPGPYDVIENYEIKPRIYYGAHIRKNYMNLIDGFAYGVYRKNLHSLALPTVSASITNEDEFYGLEVKYSFSDMPEKRIYWHHSEVRNFRIRLTLKEYFNLTGDADTDAVETIPALFNHSRNEMAVGVLPIHFEVHDEDIQGIDDKIDFIPDNLEDAFQKVVDAVHNPSWQRRYLNVTIHSPSIDWMTFKIFYKKEFIRSIVGNRVDALDLTGSLRRASSFCQLVQKDDDDDESGTSWRDRAESGRTDAEFKGVGTETTEAEKELYVYHNFTVKAETGPLEKHRAEIKVDYVETFGGMGHRLCVKVKGKTSYMGDPLKICLDQNTRFHGSPSEFHYRISQYEWQNATVHQGITFNEKCYSSNDIDIVVKGNFIKIPFDRIFEEKNFAPPKPKREDFFPETQKECEKDISEGGSQSPACLAALVGQSFMNKLEIEAKILKKLPPSFRNFTNKFERRIRHYYYPYVDVNRLVENPPDIYKMDIKYYDVMTDEPVVDVVVQKPEENVIYRRIDPGYFLPPSSIFRVHDTYILRATNNSYLPSCGLMEKHVRTYDMEMYELPIDNCLYLLSGHCTDIKKFAVLAKRLPSNNEYEIRFYAGKHEVLLTPRTNCHDDQPCYEIQYNGESLHVYPDEKAILLDEETLLYAYVLRLKDEQYVLHLIAERTGIKIKYDGSNAKIKVNPIYKGELCGLCSEFDGEITREYRGPNQCWYLDSDDFVHSSLIISEECKTYPPITGPYICPEGVKPTGHADRDLPEHHAPKYPYNPYDEDEEEQYPQGSRDDSSQPKERTSTVSRRDYLCFSTQSVPLCDEGSQPLEEYRVTVGFHCLPKDDVTTRRLISDSQHRVLTELANKKVDFTGTVSAARACSSD